jgi:hypothetical protein
MAAGVRGRERPPTLLPANPAANGLKRLLGRCDCLTLELREAGSLLPRRFGTDSKVSRPPFLRASGSPVPCVLRFVATKRD